jgi:hypothetical protein
VLNKQPKFRSDDVIIPFVRGDQGLYYLEEYVSEETSVLAMVAQRMIKLSDTDLVHIQLCHLCPTLMRHLFRVASDIPKLRGINHLNCHYCVEAKLKHGSKAKLRPKTTKINLSTTVSKLKGRKMYRGCMVDD